MVWVKHTFGNKKSLGGKTEMFALIKFNPRSKKSYVAWRIELGWTKADKDWDGRGWVVKLSGKNKKSRKIRFSNKTKAMEWIKDFKKRH